VSDRLQDFEFDIIAGDDQLLILKEGEGSRSRGRATELPSRECDAADRADCGSDRTTDHDASERQFAAFDRGPQQATTEETGDAAQDAIRYLHGPTRGCRRLKSFADGRRREWKLRGRRLGGWMGRLRERCNGKQEHRQRQGNTFLDGHGVASPHDEMREPLSKRLT
jgi:hypothetical protein